MYHSTMTALTLAVLLMTFTSSHGRSTPAPNIYANLLSIVNSGGLNSGAGASDPVFQSLFSGSGQAGSTSFGGPSFGAIMGDISQIVGMPGATTTQAPLAPGNMFSSMFGSGGGAPPASGIGPLSPSSGGSGFIQYADSGTAFPPSLASSGSLGGLGGAGGSAGGPATPSIIQYADPGNPFGPNPLPATGGMTTTPGPSPDPGTTSPPAQASVTASTSGLPAPGGAGPTTTSTPSSASLGGSGTSGSWPTMTGLGAPGSALLGGSGPLAALSGRSSPTSNDFSGLNPFLIGRNNVGSGPSKGGLGRGGLGTPWTGNGGRQPGGLNANGGGEMFAA
ncbi:PE-PGRS family protein PE_PGRS26-like isoform X2 [Littorina saxatilis]|uniref:PE-PGRS family protein PE_PGRS26-like isoform X2 n=1 Tax=Littorina saxatilis TaxID=31220 RepID=UPI0038B63EAC